MTARSLLSLAATAAAAFSLTSCSPGGDSAVSAATRPGATGWPVTALPPTAPPASAARVTLADGRSLAVWAQRSQKDGRVLSAIREPDGTWSDAGVVAPAQPFPRFNENVAVNAGGEVVAAWQLADRPQGLVFSYAQAATRSPSGRWGPVHTLSRGTNGVSAAPVAVLGDGTAAVAWSGSERRNGSYRPSAKASIRARGNWRLNELIDPSDAFDLRLTAVPSRRDFIATWTRLEPKNNRLLVSSTWDGARWSPARVVSGAQDRPQEIETASNASGLVIGAWGGNGRGLRVARRGPRGGWSVPRTLLRSGYLQGLHVTVADSGRTLITVTVWPGGTRLARLEAWLVDARAHVISRRVLSRRAVSRDRRVSPVPRIPWSVVARAFGRHGLPIVAWTTPTAGQSQTPDTAIRLSRLDGRPVEKIALSRPTAVSAVAVGFLPDGQSVVEWDAYRSNGAYSTWQSIRATP
jgi:hypothetical protein